MLRIHEIYCTILGESREAGLPCVIVRLTGCHLRCTYCDTEYAFTGGREAATEEICRQVAAFECRTVLVTGGEPLLQKDVVPLLQALVVEYDRVVLETSGTRAAVSLGQVPPQVRRVVDIKTPESGITAEQIDWEGIRTLGSTDELKFVCCDRADYEWARDVVRGSDLLPPATPITFTPAHNRLAPSDLAEWILEDKLAVRLQIQLHKILWPDRDRGI
jgi:7-carboxy-7-deazaguanine synthase